MSTLTSKSARFPSVCVSLSFQLFTKKHWKSARLICRSSGIEHQRRMRFFRIDPYISLLKQLRWNCQHDEYRHGPYRQLLSQLSRFLEPSSSGFYFQINQFVFCFIVSLFAGGRYALFAVRTSWSSLPGRSQFCHSFDSHQQMDCSESR